MDKKKTAKRQHADKYIFIACLVASVAMFIGSFFCPPVGSIDASVLKAAAILLAFATLGVAAQNLANGKDVSFQKGDLSVKIDDDNEQY